MTAIALTAAAAIAALMFITWLISVFAKDASLVDIIWGFGYVLVAWAVHLTQDDNPGAIQWLSTVLVSIWGLRLTYYLAKRNLGHGEDPRYQAMRRKSPDSFWWKSFFTVYALQGVIMFIVSLPVQVVHLPEARRSISFLAVLGLVVWAVGFYFEAVGDHQMAQFKADPANKGKVMDQGLWAWTRHPNYFGDATQWWGLGLIGLAAGWPWGFIALIGPAVMNYFLVNVSGKALLEKSLSKRRPGYAEYVENTSGFFPRPPKN